ncbi:MAG: hypothetical protein ETSY1_29970, partial [Candidatus Entotheonella factor]
PVRIVDPQTGEVNLTILHNPQRLNSYAYGLNNPYRYVDPDGEFAISGTLLGLWAVAEFGLSAYDAYDTAQTLASPETSAGEKALAIGLFAAGAIGPGGGYSQVDNVVKAGSKQAAAKGSSQLAGVSLKEAKQLLSRWDKSSYRTLSKSIRDHAHRHGFGDDIPKYLRKAANFNKKGANKKVRADGSVRYRRPNGEFLIERDGKIVTYGTE